MAEQRASRRAHTVARRNRSAAPEVRALPQANTELTLDARKRCASCGNLYPADFRVCPRDATELQEYLEAEHDPWLGLVLGDSYEIMRSIGEGGMGRVYEARHRRLTGKRFAVKVLHAELARQPEVVARFLREAEATSVLSHANIVGVLDVNRAQDGRPYIVAELLEGEQLGDYLERVGKLSVPEAVRICRQVCRALSAAHARDIVHRDIKPENVFLIGEGRERVAKVLDFGISRVGDNSGTLTKTGMVMGTPAYMPPEQALGQRVDHRADIYAVGAILYQAVTGARPFDGSDPMATLAAVISAEPTRPCTLVATLPPALEMIIQKAMAKQPVERYASMRELDLELAAFDTQPVTPRPSAPPPAIESLPPSTPANDTNAPRRAGRPASMPRRARARIVGFSAFGAVCLLAGLIDSATSTIRWARHVSTLTLTEFVLCIVGAMALLIAPTTAWVRHVIDRVWPSTPRAVELAGRVRRSLLFGLASYGVASLAVRVLEGVVRDDATALSWPGWSVLSFACALAAASGTWLMSLARRG
jgi:serine/threonine protein kinase